MVPVVASLLPEDFAELLDSVLGCGEGCVLPLAAVTDPPPASEQHVQVFGLLSHNLHHTHNTAYMGQTATHTLQWPFVLYVPHIQHSSHGTKKQQHIWIYPWPFVTQHCLFRSNMYKHMAFCHVIFVTLTT